MSFKNFSERRNVEECVSNVHQPTKQLLQHFQREEDWIAGDYVHSSLRSKQNPWSSQDVIYGQLEVDHVRHHKESLKYAE
jgi:hypothetical protein